LMVKRCVSLTLIGILCSTLPAVLVRRFQGSTPITQLH
jgi:hypothetical protein